MCGIAGIVDSLSRPIEAELLRAMARPLAHRGPDHEGVWVNTDGQVQGQRPTAGLGHRRLSIIDISPSAHQPLCNEDGSVWVVTNGEIYNFPELKEELEGRGHVFRSRSDTEVLVHGYEEWGEGLLGRLRGMYAFGIWDDRRGRLLLARDRLGKKPLYYSEVDDQLLFASEIKALLAHPGVTVEVDLEALDAYLTYQYVPAPRTMFRGIRKLLPAHYLLWEGGRSRVERYWQISLTPKHSASEEELIEGIWSELREAVRCRLISDVPLGAFLSGGVDSSAVVAVMSELVDGPVKTFSIGFEDQAYDETVYARQVAERFATDHQELIVKPDAVAILPKLVWHYNEPFADSSALPCFYLAEMARREVTVVLNGDGGDEAFGGYERYFALRYSERYRHLPAWLRRGLIEPVVTRAARGNHSKVFVSKLARFLQTTSDYPQASRRYGRWLSYFSDVEKSNLYSDDFKAALGAIDAYSYFAELFSGTEDLGPVDQAIACDIAAYLPEDLLVKMDVATMAYALEARSPFLDHRLMEFAVKIPEALKVRGWTTKYLLKRALEKVLPRAWLDRPKMGFGVPLDAWFRGELGEMSRDLLLSSHALGRGYFNPQAVEALIAEHEAGKAHHGFKLWTLLILELWHQMFVDADQPLEPPGSMNGLASEKAG
ncbi:MAG: asparagine synthase (glutamine-hydrolyzing) [bacterium]|nr:asparagine synthase (glutamine-hydrolyzing) [bacterium]